LEREIAYGMGYRSNFYWQIMDTIENRILRTTKTNNYLFYLTFDFFNLHLHQNKNLTTRKNENIMLALNQHTKF